MLTAAYNFAIGVTYHTGFNTVFAACIVALLIGDWWNRRGKRIAKALGEKSRMLLARLVVASA
jgi:hypothetical protein